MKVVLAFDKFKGSATAQQLNDAARQAVENHEGLTVVSVPIADGGDGTTAVLAANMQGQWVTVSVPAPLLPMPPVNASYFLCDNGTAIIEVAAASGLALLAPYQRDVMRATTLGTGLLMRDTIEHGAQRIVLGMGGTATCDAGMGALCALGAEFLDAQGRHLYPCGESLGLIERIETSGIPQEIRDCRFTMLADVDNPLCGEHGAACTFAPQKGATPQQVNQLEQGMMRVAAIVGDGIACHPGCGVAGGMAALMMHLLDCELLPGAPYVFARNGMSEALDGADLVITGEGRLDRQTLMGKGPGLVISMAHDRGIPVVAVCGAIDADFDPMSAGLSASVAVSEGLPLDEAMDTRGTLQRVAYVVSRLVTELNHS